MGYLKKKTLLPEEIKTYAFDFDGTYVKHAFPEIGEIEPINQKIIDLSRQLWQNGHTIILWTCRTNCSYRNYLDEAVQWLADNNIPIDHINCNPVNAAIFDGMESRKVYADLYIDDKAINIYDIESTLSQVVKDSIDD